MVDKPRLTPQAFAKGGSQGAPRLSAQMPNFRAAPSVTAFADASIADTLVGMADDAKRLEMLSSNQFDASMQQFQNAQAEIEEQQAIEAEGELNRILTSADASISNVRLNSGVDTVAKDSVQAYDDVQSQVLENANLSAFQKKYLAPKLESTRQSVASSAAKFQTSVRQEEARNTLKQSLETREFLVNKHPDQLPVIMAEMEETINTLGANLPQTERRRIIEQQQERLTSAAVASEIRTNPTLALNKIESGAYNDVLNLKQVQTLQADAEIGIRKAHAEANKIAKAENAKLNADLGVSISVGELSTLPTFSQLDTLRDRDVLSDTQWESHYKGLANRLEKAQDENKDLNLGSVIFENKLPVNSENKDAEKAFNAYYNNQQPQIAAMPPEQRITHSVDIIKTHRAVPKLLKGEVKLAATSGDPEKVKVVTEMVDKLSNEAPYLMPQLISDKDRQRIDMINKRLNIGMEPKEAILQTDQQLSILNQVSNESIQQELNKLTSEVDFREETKAAFTGFFDFLPGVSNLETEGQAAFDMDRATAVYRLAYEDAYRSTRDAGLAETKAKEAVTGRFGRSSINGFDQTLEFPPERYYAIEGEDNAWLRKQMIDEAKSATKNSMLDPKTARDFDRRLRLLPDPYLTPRLAKSGRPGYNLVIIGEDGTPRQLNPDGQLFFFDAAQRKQELLDEAQEPSTLGNVLNAVGLGDE
jgi:hypothetical protein